LLKRQEEQAAASNIIQEVENSASTSYLPTGVSEAPSERQVGMKAKREDDENDDVEWEEAPPAGKFYSPWNYSFPVNCFLLYIAIGVAGAFRCKAFHC